MRTSDPEAPGGGQLFAFTNCSPVSPLQTSGVRHYRSYQGAPPLPALRGRATWKRQPGTQSPATFAPQWRRTPWSARSPAVRPPAGPRWSERTRTQGPQTPTCQLPFANVPPQQIPGSSGGVPQLLAQRPPERRVHCSAWAAHLSRVLIARGSLAAASGAGTLGHAGPGAPARRPARRPLRSTSPSLLSGCVLPLSYPPSPAPPCTLA